MSRGPSVVLEFKVPERGCQDDTRNFKFTTLVLVATAIGAAHGRRRGARRCDRLSLLSGVESRYAGTPCGREAFHILPLGAGFDLNGGLNLRIEFDIGLFGKVFLAGDLSYQAGLVAVGRRREGLDLILRGDDLGRSRPRAIGYRWRYGRDALVLRHRRRGQCNEQDTAQQNFPDHVPSPLSRWLMASCIQRRRDYCIAPV